jgi:hypothetical protein
MTPLIVLLGVVAICNGQPGIVPKECDIIADVARHSTTLERSRSGERDGVIR